LLFIPVVACSTAYGAAKLQSFSLTGSQGSTSLFSEIGTQGNRPVGAGATWSVTVDLQLLNSKPTSVILNFPDRVYATVDRMRFEERGSGFLWTGKGDGCVAVFNEDPTGFHGVLSCLNANYGVEPQGSGQTLTRYDAVVGATPVTWEGTPAIVNVPEPPGGTQFTPAQVDTSIDILVLYTQAVKTYLASVGDTPSAFIKRCIDTTQAALDASTPTGQSPIETVNLVAAKQVSRTENNDNFTADLLWMNDPTQDPAKLRAFWAADVVIYMTEDTGTTYGQSNQPKANGLPAPGPSFAPYASSVVMRSHAIYDNTNDAIPEPYVFMHEFAHTLGADHDYGNAVNPTNPVEPWSFGHWAPNSEGGERTIMSYLVSPDCTAPCPRTLFYSNSLVYDGWFRTGIPNQSENARTIADYGPTAAQYQLSLTRIFYDGFEP
jgi:hypothetical protein